MLLSLHPSFPFPTAPRHVLKFIVYICVLFLTCH